MREHCFDYALLGRLYFVSSMSLLAGFALYRISYSKGGSSFGGGEPGRAYIPGEDSIENHVRENGVISVTKGCSENLGRRWGSKDGRRLVVPMFRRMMVVSEIA